MHYYIDGYNLLFRLLHGSEDLQSEREAIIRDLNEKISLVKIDATIVFDATFQVGERTQRHFHHLEILFSAEGETADEYIIDEIKNNPHPQQEIVVTSDKTLALRVRNRSAHTETVEEFTSWLNRAYKNKIRQHKKDQHSSHVPNSPKLPAVSTQSHSVLSSLIPTQDTPLESLTDYYTQVFESHWQEILIKEEEKRKEMPTSQTVKKRTPSSSKRSMRDPFEPPQTAEEKAATEEERWIKIFEKRLKD